ncbi:hypothetical protein M427DRAFT_154073 [Gonapodya prolifera JEL478]|uniref:Uncharacterized protein n=1 Tax=Gonapodya prolifera (strain JEL478) TaxID=1344416 RepID=A0A139AJI4_GONPJ|nr:hypothetical protein M427DRAFT_154073 [Gonapodya prolifera JEL478]|eukprot:KXS16919.1 hypothetical protein M427DRAFT_154073 [Gonapodya prolifera JEL478]
MTIACGRCLGIGARQHHGSDQFKTLVPPSLRVSPVMTLATVTVSASRCNFPDPGVELPPSRVHVALSTIRSDSVLLHESTLDIDTTTVSDLLELVFASHPTIAPLVYGLCLPCGHRHRIFAGEEPISAAIAGTKCPLVLYRLYKPDPQSPFELYLISIQERFADIESWFWEMEQRFWFEWRKLDLADVATLETARANCKEALSELRSQMNMWMAEATDTADRQFVLRIRNSNSDSDSDGGLILWLSHLRSKIDRKHPVPKVDTSWRRQYYHPEVDETDAQPARMRVALEDPHSGDDRDDTVSFEIKSDSILWGDLSCIAGAGASTLLDRPLLEGDPPPTPGNDFRYKSKARNGTWRVSQVHCDLPGDLKFSDDVEDMDEVGVVIYHESVNPGDVVLRASLLGSGMKSVDPRIVPIGRYNFHYDRGHFRRDDLESQFRAQFKDQDADEVAAILDKLENQIGGHFVVLDGGKSDMYLWRCVRASVPTWQQLNNYEWDPDKPTRVFVDSIEEDQQSSTTPFGVYCRPPSGDYSRGWLIFDQAPSETNASKPVYECVALIYSPNDHMWAMCPDRFAVNGRKYPEADAMKKALSTMATWA